MRARPLFIATDAMTLGYSDGAPPDPVVAAAGDRSERSIKAPLRRHIRVVLSCDSYELDK